MFLQRRRSRRLHRPANVAVEWLEERLLLAYSATLSSVGGGHSVTFVGDSAGDVLTLDVDGQGRLRHNRFAAGDPGFASSIDLDSTLAGVQSVNATSQNSGLFVGITAGDGDDTINIGTATVPVTAFDFVEFGVDGEGGTDSLNVDDTANPNGTGSDPGVLTANSFDGNFLNYVNLENLTISGGAGVDHVDVLGTADGTLTQLFGGPGDDSASVFATGLAGLILDGQVGNDTAEITFGNLAGPVTVVDYGATFTGSDADETLVLTDTEVTNGGQSVDLTNTTNIPTISGGGGADTIDASAATRSLVLDGGAGNDTITAGGGNDQIIGGDGDDELTGGLGDDTFLFGDSWGVDLVEADGTADHDLMDFSAVTSNLTITLGSVTVQDGAGNEARHTGDRIEAVTSGSGNDSVICTASTGKLILQLRAGDDQVDCSDSPVGLNIDGGAGDDSFQGSPANDVLIGGDGDDTLGGNAGDDTLVGGPGGDTLTDVSGTNSLVGGPGCDVLNGVGDPPSCSFPSAQFSAANYVVRESGKTATISITLEQAAGTPGSVSYALTAGTATAGADFTITNGTIAFAAGQTAQRITIPIRNDKTDEDDETVFLTLTGTTGSIGLGELTEATLTIQDDDAAPTLRLPKSVKVRETAGSAAITISLSSASGRQISVELTTQNGTAEDGNDFTGSDSLAQTFIVIFQPGQRTQVVGIDIINDSDVEPKESFSAVIGNAVNATLPVTPRTTIAITSDDSPARAAVRFHIAARFGRRLRSN